MQGHLNAKHCSSTSSGQPLFNKRTNRVTDDQGRTKFRGAFSGALTARYVAYHGTVGSKEGFTPVEWQSSRSRRTQISQQNVTMFMDDEDEMEALEDAQNLP